MKRANKYICTLLPPIFLIYSCTFTYKKSNRASIDSYYEKINLYSERFATCIFLNSEEEHEVKNLSVQKDSTSFTPIDSHRSIKISTSEIKYVEIRDVTRGAIGGLLMGLLGGLLVGFTAFALLPEGGGHPDMSGFVIIYGVLMVVQ